MKLKKILTAIAATAVMTSLFAIGASAAGEITNVDYNAGTGKVAFTLPAYEAAQKTLLVVKAKADGSIEIADQYIMQIDQNSTGWTEAQLALNLEAGTKFQIYAGGDGNLYTSNVYEVTAGGGSKYDDPTRKLGDANLDNNINMSDASVILDYALKLSVLEGDALQCADANDDGNVNMSDASSILDYALKLDTALEGKTLADKINYVE